MKGAALAVLMLLCSVSWARAADLSQVYDRPTLKYWGERYTRSTTKILDEVIWPALFTEERARLGRKKPVLEFPLYGEGEARHQALAFYVPPDRASIVFPIFSLKVLDDLCTAYAWLQVKGYGVETVSEYTAILKYGTPPAGGFPPPLKALGIPDHALDDPKVDALALGHFVTARTFLLLHEMGHLVYGHRARSFAESVRNEQQADRFATTVMQRTPLPPIGILIFFMADAHWSGFPASGRHTHPLSGARVRALADSLDHPSLAKQLRDLGELLDDPDIRAGFVATGKAGDLTALAPRRPGELPRRRVESGLASREVREVLFDGVYRGEFVQFLDPGPMAMEFVLKRRGDGVTGSYSFGLGVGTIDGKVVGNKLHVRWKWASNTGRGILEGHDDGSIAGTWGYHKADSGAGTWIGRRDP